MNIKRQSLAVRTLTSKKLWRSVIGTVTILLILVGGGAAYTWWMGRHAKVAPAVESATTTQSEKPFFEPTAPDPKANVGVGIQVLTSPLAPGSNASISVHTYPDATCTIDVKYNEVAAVDTGLHPKTADKYGLATWSWSVPEDTPLGTWPVWVRCAHHDKNGQVRGDLVVVKST